ncbi:TPA: O-antigen ligase family protein [Photobacterium damselae]
MDKFKITYLVPLLVFFAPLIHLGGSDNQYLINSIIHVPFFISKLSQILLYFTYGYIILSSIIYSFKFGFPILSITYPFVFLYLFIFVFALSNNNEVIRYLMLLLVTLSFPIYLKAMLYEGKINNIFYFISKMSKLYILLSMMFCIINLNSFRWVGMLGNPNIFGACLFSSVILLLVLKKYDDDQKYLNFYFIVSVIMILFSASRSVMLVTSLLILTQAKSIKALMFLLFITFSIGFYLYVNNLFFVFDRFDSIFNGYISLAQSSGRGEVWNAALNLIYENPFIGNGMTEPLKIIGSYNVHNSYLRILVMVGLPAGLVIIGSLFFGIFNILFKKIDIELKVYFLSFLILISSEDFIVGIGSGFIFYFFLILSITSIKRES